MQQQALQGAELQGVEDTRVKQTVRAGMHSSSQAHAQHAQHAQHARHGLADPEIDDHYDEAQRHPDAPKHVGGVDDDAGGACRHACRAIDVGGGRRATARSEEADYNWKEGRGRGLLMT